MSEPRHLRTLPIRRWLGLALLAIFLAPMLTMGVIGFLLFHENNGPAEIEEQVEERLQNNADRWADPPWQSELGEWLASENADVVLVEGDQVVFRTSEDPLISTSVSSRRARQIVLPDSDPPRRAYIYTDPQSGPPEELREWFVPVALIAALLLALAGIGWFLRRSITIPLTATSEAARRVAAGELDISLPSSRVREVAELNEAFVAMSEGLRESIERQAELEGERRMLIGAIVHDLRTPLFSLRGSLEGLATGVADTPEKRDRYIAVAQDKAATLERLIADLFAFTRIEYLDESPDRGPLELASFLPGIVDGLRPHADAKGVRLNFEMPSTPVTVQGDRHMLTRAIDNLLDNALRHTPEDGTVQIAWRATGSRAEIAVSDTGPGIPEQDLPHVFDPLFRGEASRNRRTGGAGLGLTIARRIATAHGGNIAVRNASAGGAIFVITLPLQV